MTGSPTLKQLWSEAETLRYELTRARRRLEAADRLVAEVRRAMREIPMLGDAAPGLAVALREFEAGKGETQKCR